MIVTQHKKFKRRSVKSQAKIPHVNPVWNFKKYHLSTVLDAVDFIDLLKIFKTTIISAFLLSLQNLLGSSHFTIPSAFICVKKVDFQCVIFEM